jgi:hypothetical protein
MNVVASGAYISEEVDQEGGTETEPKDYFAVLEPERELVHDWWLMAFTTQ